MTRYRKALLGVMAVLLLVGCGVSKYPISAPAIKIDERLLGKWKTVKVKKKDRAQFTVSKQDDFHYLISFSDHGEKGEVLAFLSDFNNARFLNVYIPHDSAYFFFRILKINATADSMFLSPVVRNDNDTNLIQNLTTPSETQAYVTRHMNDRDTLHFVKIK